MATGGFLLSNKNFVETLLSSPAYKDVFGGDMEAWGLATAFQMFVDKGVLFQWIVVKGVCDFGYDKTDGYQPLAAAAAAHLVHTVLNRKGVASGLKVCALPS